MAMDDIQIQIVNEKGDNFDHVITICMWWTTQEGRVIFVFN